MARYQILSWQEIPAQVRAEDDNGKVQLELGPRFEVMIDQIATERGLVGTDDYLEAWLWGEELEREGTAQEVAEAVVKELLAKYPE